MSGAGSEGGEGVIIPANFLRPPCCSMSMALVAQTAP